MKSLCIFVYSIICQDLPSTAYYFSSILHKCQFEQTVLPKFVRDEQKRLIQCFLDAGPVYANEIVTQT